MDLVIDQEALLKASKELHAESERMNKLRSNIVASFEQLKKDWDSEAGKKFFERFETDLLKNLEQHSKVLEYMSNNLTTASVKYEEVFRDADIVAKLQY